MYHALQCSWRDGSWEMLQTTQPTLCCILAAQWLRHVWCREFLARSIFLTSRHHIMLFSCRIWGLLSMVLNHRPLKKGLGTSDQFWLGTGDGQIDLNGTVINVLLLVSIWIWAAHSHICTWYYGFLQHAPLALMPLSPHHAFLHFSSTSGCSFTTGDLHWS